MKISLFVLLVIMKGVSIRGGHGKHHVHFKIHVPEIVQHHIHTKTIFIHHHPVRGGKKKEVPNKEVHHSGKYRENWNSWSTYDHYGGGKNNDNKGAYEHVTNHGKDYSLGGSSGDNIAHPLPYDYDERHNTKDPQQILPDSYSPLDLQHYDAGHGYGRIEDHGDRQAGHLPLGNVDQPLIGYSYPPQYSVHEMVDDVPPEDIDSSVKDHYVEGYRKGLISESGHLISNELKNFYDDKHEVESLDSENGYDDDSFEKRNSQYYNGERENFGNDALDNYDTYSSNTDDKLSAVSGG